MDRGQPYEGLLIDPPMCLPFLFHIFFWESPNDQYIQGELPDLAEIIRYYATIG